MQTTKSWSKTIEPTSYEQIYKYIEQSLDQCSTYIDEAELQYFQGTSNLIPSLSKSITSTNRPLSLSTLQAWSQPLNNLREVCLLNDIRSNKAIRELLNEARTGSAYGPITDDSVILIKRILDRTVDQLYSKIPMMINQITEMMNLMEQYFLSFYEIENIQDVIRNRKKEKLPDEYLETAYTYEKSRWLHMFEVTKVLKILRELPQRAEDVKGVPLTILSKECQELALRCDCMSLPYLFILPECYLVSRNALNALRKWLNEDMKYNEFIQTSLKLLEEKYLEAKKALDLIKSQLSQIEYRAESYRLQITKFEQELESNEKKLEDFERRLNLKEREYVSKRLTFEVYEEQLNKLQKSSNESIDNHLAIERFQQDIKQLAKEFPRLKLQVEALQIRMNQFQQRKQELSEMKKESKKFDNEIQSIFEEKILKENYFHRIKTCRDLIRNIYKYRTTNDLPQKIFYDLPIKVKDNDNDDLSRASRIIAKSIGKDWNRLYWQLPFYPTRGQEELAKDIQHIDEKYQRGHVYQIQATDALNKWRRFHTRAKVDDLVHGLKQIRRMDIIQLLERRVLKTKHSLNMEQEEIDPRKKEIEDLNKKLIKLFDKLRTGAIKTRDTCVYSTIGLDPLRPIRQSASTSRTNRRQPSRTVSMSVQKSLH